MRTLLVGAAALAVIASTAAAADFDVNAPDLPLADASAGSTSIEDCTNGIHLDVLHGDAYQADIDDWYVTGVRLAVADHHADRELTLGALCENFTATVAIDAGEDNLVMLPPTLITAPMGLLDIAVPDGSDIPAGDVLDASLVIDHDPTLADTDGDGITDADEVAAASDAINSDSTPERCDDQVDNDRDGAIDEDCRPERVSFAGSRLSISDTDDSIDHVQLPFEFEFWGTSFTSMVVSSNGYLTFDSSTYSSGCCRGLQLPAQDGINGVIAGWWGDLCPRCGGEVTWGVVGEAPNRTVLVDFDNVTHCCSPDHGITTFQFQLHESTHRIDVVYDLVGTRASWDVHTVGIENLDGTRGLQVAWGEGVWPHPSTVSYHPDGAGGYTHTVEISAP